MVSVNNLWSASVVIRCGQRVRQTLFHTIGGTGTVRREKERGVLRVGSCSEKNMSLTLVPEGCSVDAQAFSVLFLRAVVQPLFLLRVVYKAVLVARAANHRRSRDAFPAAAKRCTCWSGWNQCAFKHGLVTPYPDCGICSSNNVCLFLLKHSPVAGVLESNAISQHIVENARQSHIWQWASGHVRSRSEECMWRVFGGWRTLKKISQFLSAERSERDKNSCSLPF